MMGLCSEAAVGKRDRHHVQSGMIAGGILRCRPEISYLV
jgi:hypothetical protein